MNAFLAVVGGAHDRALPQLADAINVATEHANDHAKAAVLHALDAGKLLIEAKARVPHGVWHDWLTTNIIVAPRTAQAYMRLASSIPLLPPEDAQRVADLPLRKAMDAIATKAEPPTRVSDAPRRMSRTEAERAVESLRKSAYALRAAATHLVILNEIKPERAAAQLKALRSKLIRALEDVDRLASPDRGVEGSAS